MLGDRRGTNSTYSFVSTTRILRRLQCVTMTTANRGVVVCHVLGANYVMMGGGTGRIPSDRELSLNVDD